MPPPPPRSPGFTLIELLIVVALIAILATVLMPQFGGGLGLALQGASERVAADLQYTGQRAVATGAVHRWTLDLDAQRFRLEERVGPEHEDPEGAPTHRGLLDLTPPLPAWEFIEVAGKAGRWRSLEEAAVAIDSVWIGDDEYDDGAVSVAFAPQGGADPALIRLVDDYGYGIDVEVLAFTGEVRIRDELDDP